MATKKKLKFAIVTNEMPDDVYKFLEKKADRKELTPYIIKLVQQDMLNQQIQIHFEDVHNTLRSLAEKIERIERIQERDNSNQSNQSQGQNSILTVNPEVNVTGYIEEDTELDF